MGIFLSIIGGLVAIVLGVWGIMSWWTAFVEILKGIVPCILILGGLIAFFAGINEAKEAASRAKEEKKEEIKTQ